jgi:hypothetical protein
MLCRSANRSRQSSTPTAQRRRFDDDPATSNLRRMNFNSANRQPGPIVAARRSLDMGSLSAGRQQ